jgi:hypothetical protein
MMAGVRMVHVPYRGAAPALTDLIAGQVQVLFSAVTSSIEYIKGGQVRALAVTTAERSQVLPELPTVGEFVPGYEASNWWGVGAPKSPPAAIVDKLNSEINAALADPKMAGRLAELGGTVLPGPPAVFGDALAKLPQEEEAAENHARSRRPVTPSCSAQCTQQKMLPSFSRPWPTMWMPQFGQVGASEWIAHSKLSKVWVLPFMVTWKALS